MARKMLKSLSFVLSSWSVSFPQNVTSSRLILSFVRFVHNGRHDKSSIDLEDKEEAREQFNASIPIEHLKIKYSRSPGPGGQNVNKVNTKVDLRFHVMTAQWMPYWIREKLQEKEPNRINKEGELVVQSNRFRNQQKNLEDGLQKLREILEDVSHIPKETAEEKKGKISEMIKTDNQRRLQEKKYRSQRKKERSQNE